MTGSVYIVSLLILTTSTLAAIYNVEKSEVVIDNLPVPSQYNVSLVERDHMHFLGYEGNFAFIGGRNHLMVINMSSSIKNQQLDFRKLPLSPNMTQSDECLELFEEGAVEREFFCKSTFIRAIFRRPKDNAAVLCGTLALQPRCWLCRDAADKHLHKASDMFEFDPEIYKFEEITSGKDIVPFEPNSQFTNFISDNTIYSGIYETPEVNTAIVRPVVVSRSLDDFDSMNHSENKAPGASLHVIAEPASLSSKIVLFFYIPN